jgi:hypothetical protein
LHLFLIPLESVNGDSQMIFVLPKHTPFAAGAKRRGRTRQFARITKTAGGTRPFIAWAALSPVARNRPQTRFARAPSPLHRQHSLETFENGHLQGSFAGTARGTCARHARREHACNLGNATRAASHLRAAAAGWHNRRTLAGQAIQRLIRI